MSAPTKLYHMPRAGMIWLVAFANGKWHWLAPKAPIGACIR